MAKDHEWVWVLSWVEKGSGGGVMRAYSDETRAEEDRDLCASENTKRVYTIEEIPVYAGKNSPR